MVLRTMARRVDLCLLKEFDSEWEQNTHEHDVVAGSPLVPQVPSCVICLRDLTLAVPGRSVS